MWSRSMRFITLEFRLVWKRYWTLNCLLTCFYYCFLCVVHSCVSFIFWRLICNMNKMGENTADVHTQRTNSVKDNIRVLFGSKVANELIEINFKDDQKLKFTLKAYITNPNYKSKKNTFILFINSKRLSSSIFFLFDHSKQTTHSILYFVFILWWWMIKLFGFV
jgi:hypothetical protein